MNNNIEEDYCSFEVSKLLKEKGFQVPTVFYFRITGGHMFPQPNPFNHNDDSKNETAGGMTYVSAPTHALAIKWIRENFHIHIWVEKYLSESIEIFYEYFVDNHVGNSGYGYNNPEEATEAALLYTLKNLIP